MQTNEIFSRLHGIENAKTYYKIDAIENEGHINGHTCCQIIPEFLERRAADHHDEGISIAAKIHLNTTEKLKKQRKRNINKTRSIAAKRGIKVAKRKSYGATPITVYQGNHRTSLPGKVIDNPMSDVAAHEAFDGAKKTAELYLNVFKRASVDGKNMPLLSTVHYSHRYNNAFWNGKQMVYGDGDGKVFNRFTCAIDVIGHELTHGVTQFAGELDYEGQSGALNESMSDVFGTIVKQYSLNQTIGGADWLIGKGLLVGDYSLRSMSAPGTAYVNHPVLGTDPQPATMSGYVEGEDDNGGVHINSGIPNHAFYLVCKDLEERTGDHEHPIHSWEKPGQIWYNTHPLLKSNAEFTDMATETIQAAVKLYGKGDPVIDSLRRAWTTVEVKFEE